MQTVWLREGVVRVRAVSGKACALAALLLALSIPVPGFCAQAVLTDLERYYVEQEGDVTLCVDPDWVPFESINEKGEHEGIAADLLRLVSERTGLRFRLVRTKSWDESLDYSKKGQCQALSFLNETPARDEWLSFSDPIFTDVNVFITREEHDFISDPGGLVNETLVLPRGTSIEEFIRKDYPNIRVVIVESEADAFRMVSERKADMALRSLIMAAYTIKKGGWFNLKIAGQLPEYTNKLRVGVVKDKEKLAGIINRGIRSISGQDRGAIVNRHVSINVQTVEDHALLYKVSAVLLAAVAVAVAWVWQLKRHNRELERISQTDALTGLANRTRLNAVVGYECARARRGGHPLSLVLIDLDYFKKINDEQGHLAGDQVLAEVGALLRDNVRGIDVAGRWGGEEFLIVCPETDAASALTVANRIVDMIAGHEFSSGRRQTASAGVAALADGEEPDGLLSRADAALYEAKKGGRNRSCCA